MVLNRMMIARIICVLLCFFSFGFHAAAAPLNVRGAILMDLDSVKVLYKQNENKKIPPASLTKIMTMYLVFDAIKAKKSAWIRK